MVLSLPVWLRVARHLREGDACSSSERSGGRLIQLAICFVQPSWPRWSLFAIAGLAAIGYAVADLMPWSMLGEVIDEDELATGERREGVYVGFFMFLRKLGGGVGVAGIGFALDLCGFDGALAARAAERRSRSRRSAVSPRCVPAAFLLLAAWIARGYPLDRAAHARILEAIARRETLRPGSAGSPESTSAVSDELGHARVQAEA